MMHFCHCLPDSTDGVVRHTCDRVPGVRPSTQPYVCVVCSGRGSVPANFYNDASLTSFSTARETCRSCSGTGVLWGPSPTPV